MIPENIISDIQTEYRKQLRLHGGINHDLTHTVAEWSNFRNEYENKNMRISAVESPSSKRSEMIRENLIKIATLALAEIRAMDYNL